MHLALAVHIDNTVVLVYIHLSIEYAIVTYCTSCLHYHSHYSDLNLLADLK